MKFFIKFCFVIILVCCAFGILTVMDIKPKEFDDFSLEGYSIETYEYERDFENEFYINSNRKPIDL